MAERIMAEPGGGDIPQPGSEGAGSTGGSVPPEGVSSSEVIHSLPPQVPPEGITSSEVIHSLPRSEIPRGPEGPADIEFEDTPEYGRYLVEEIVRYRTTMSYEERYNAENGPKLKKLYDNLQAYVYKICRERHERNPWDPYIRDSEGNVVGLKRIEETPLLITYDEDGIPHLEQPSQTGQGLEVRQSEQPEGFIGPLRLLNYLATRYEDRTTPVAELPFIEGELSVYYRRAKDKGLLQGVDNILTDLYKSIKQRNISSNQAVRLTAQALDDAEVNVELIFSSKRIDQDIEDLDGVWRPYIRKARQKFALAIAGQGQPFYREGEFRLDLEEEGQKGGETYWEVGNYPKYYNITAETPEQFLIAKESFLRMIRRGSLGKSPEAIFQHVDNFKDVFGQRGEKQVESGNIDNEFLLEQRLELEAQLYVFGADYSNEVYNPKQFKDFMTAMALHEGPERWTRLQRVANGQVAAFTYLFDKEVIMEIFNNPVGERGELDIAAQHFVQDQIKQIVIERGMGFRLKDYDPRNADLRSNFGMRVDLASKLERIQAELRGGKKLNQLSVSDQILYKAGKTNLERIGLHLPNEDFRNLFEGFENGDVHSINYWQFQKDQQLPPAQRVIKDPDNLPDSLRKSINLGRIQVKLDFIRDQVRNGETTLKWGQTTVDLLGSEDKKAYQDAFESAEANFGIAFQMQGVSGEKVRRGKGFFYIDRNPHIQVYQAVRERSERIEWLLGELQKFKETKGKEGKKLEDFSEEIQNFYKGLTEEEKRKTSYGLYSIDSGRFLPQQQKSIQIGWMLAEMADGRRLDSFTQAEQDLYNSLSVEEKEIFVDHTPTYLAEKFVQCAETLTKMKYADDAQIWNDRAIRNDSFARKIKEENKKNGYPELESFKAHFRAAMVDQARARAISELKAKGWEAKIYDEDGNIMKIKTPRLRRNADGSIYKDPKTNKTATEVVDEVEVTFQVAVDPNNIYNRYSTHTYWGYQGENRHTILQPHILEGAERIREGQSRPEDEDLMAVQLVIIDPTGKRVVKLPADQEQREFTLLQAAVNESYLNRTRIVKDLFKTFLPKDGNRGKMRAGYNMEDWGGMMRFTMGIRELMASQPARFARRLGAEIAIAPMYLDSMGSLWGGEGVLAAVSCMADQIKRFTHQGVVGQFGITKFINMQDYGVHLYNALIGSVQEGQHVEGIYMKPTNDNENLHRFIEEVNKIETNPKFQMEFLQEFRKTLARLEKTLKIMRPMYSDERNAGGALDLRKVDIFLPNGRFNPAIERDPSITMNTGTSRQLEVDFYNEESDWLISEWPGGGGQIYPEELPWNKFLKKQSTVYSGTQMVGSILSRRSFQEWFFDKAGL